MGETLSLDLAKTGVSKAKTALEKAFMEDLIAASESKLNRVAFTGEEVQRFVKLWNELDLQTDSLLFAHSAFFGISKHMNKIIEDYALDEVEDRLFPEQVKALKQLILFAQKMADYYTKKKQDEQAG